MDTNAPVNSIVIPLGQAIAAQETSQVTMQGNLDSASVAAPIADTFSTTIDAYDSLGAPHPVVLTYTKTATPNEWDVSAASADPKVTSIAVDTGAGATTVTFDSSGRRTAPPIGTKMKLDVVLAASAGAANFTINVNQDQLTQFAGPGAIAPTFNNGFSAGSLQSFSVGPGGDITGIFSNGTTRPLGQVAMAIFTNASGLQRAGANNFEATSNSGVPNIGTPGTGGRGSIGAGVLEGSNTDLAREFTNVVIAQRGFQASSKIISTADSMLEGLVNLIR